MTEKEKMISGKIYDPSDKELVALRTKAHRLSKEYNELLETDQKREDIIKKTYPLVYTSEDGRIRVYET